MPAYRYKDIANGRTVNAIHYLSGKSNQDEVMEWLDATLPSPWGTSRTAKAGGHYELIGIYRSVLEPIWIHPGQIVGVYTDKEEIVNLPAQDFHSKFIILPPELPAIHENSAYRTIKTIGATRRVISCYYHFDAKNIEQVTEFLRENARRDAQIFFSGATTTDICIDIPHLSRICIVPGSVVVVYLDNGDVSFMSPEHFPSYFEKDDTTNMQAPETYVKNSERNGYKTSAIFFQKGINNAATLAFLGNYGVASISSGELVFKSYTGLVEVINASTRKPVDLSISDRTWITVTERPNDLPLLVLYGDEGFRDKYSKYTEPVKINASAFMAAQGAPLKPQYKEVTTFNLDSEYGQNRIAVLDALAHLRTSPTDSTFELVTNELMDLLATAFNEGWDEGIEAGQRNPYENRWDA